MIERASSHYDGYLINDGNRQRGDGALRSRRELLLTKGNRGQRCASKTAEDSIHPCHFFGVKLLYNHTTVAAYSTGTC